MRVSLFITCFNDTIFPRPARPSSDCSNGSGMSVDFPRWIRPVAARCTTTRDISARRSRWSAGSSRSSRTPRSSSAPRPRASAWSATFTPQAAELADDPEAGRRRRGDHPPKVFELSEFLVNKLGVEDVGRVLSPPGHVSPDLPLAPDDPGRRRPVEAPQGGPKGIDLVELPRAEECCGFGGTFAVKNADTSMAMLGDKLRCILDTRAEFCASADNSCLMHIGGALHRQRAGVGADPPCRDPGFDRQPEWRGTHR